MSSIEPQAARLVSQLLRKEPNLRAMVEEFVRGLDERFQELRRVCEKLDWDLMVSLTHRLKGAGGSYGYPDISRLCAEMEQHFQAHQAGDLADSLTRLNALIEAAREGLPQGP